MTYEETAKALRLCGSDDESACQKCPRQAKCSEDKNMGGLLRDSADVIEELIPFKKQVEKGMGLLDKADELLKAVKPRWVSVTEQLPNAYEDVLLQFPNNQAAGFCDRDGCWGVYSGDGFYTEVADNEPKPTHWAKKLPEPPKEEAPVGPYDLLYEEGGLGIR